MPVEDDTNPVLKQRSGVLDFAIGDLRPTSLVTRAAIAQLGERQTEDLKVPSSVSAHFAS